ncbi:MAG: hypothetical protein KF767_12630 [Bdellovibrionaceae bacterium]|nr:hypothetical protein [Pseudobdellovibrionaceae bacterium]
MRSLIALLFLFAFIPAQAIEIIDPRGELERLNDRLGRPTWESAIRCGERVGFSRSVLRCEAKCSAHMCVDTCTDAPPEARVFDLAVEDCTEDSAAIYGTNNFAAEFTRADFERSGSWLVPLLQNFEHFRRPVTSIEIQSVFHRTVSLIENGQLRQESGVSVNIDVRTSASSMGQLYQIVFLRRPTLLESLVYVGDMHTDFYLKKKGVAGVR